MCSASFSRAPLNRRTVTARLSELRRRLRHTSTSELALTILHSHTCHYTYISPVSLRTHRCCCRGLSRDVSRTFHFRVLESTVSLGMRTRCSVDCVWILVGFSRLKSLARAFGDTACGIAPHFFSAVCICITSDHRSCICLGLLSNGGRRRGMERGRERRDSESDSFRPAAAPASSLTSLSSFTCVLNGRIFATPRFVGSEFVSKRLASDHLNCARSNWRTCTRRQAAASIDRSTELRSRNGAG